MQIIWEAGNWDNLTEDSVNDHTYQYNLIWADKQSFWLWQLFHLLLNNKLEHVGARRHFLAQSSILLKPPGLYLSFLLVFVPIL